MTASLSDENEPVIDIFILSANPVLSSQLENQLKEEGYYVTLFSDGSHLLENLRNGKPNLLICDTTVPDADAFEVCRQIKADDYLWNIPVLIITGAFDLGDLLRVLDCNADNFIAHPFDPPYLISLLEGMLTVPVERQTPEQIKTQFKIKHDDQVFVVTADRRKLLEFLLSSFEIAVNKSADLSRLQEDIRNLGTTIRNLEITVDENNKVIGIINENLRGKEQKLSELSGQLAGREETIREKTTTIDQLSGDLAATRTAHDDALREIQSILKEKDESAAAHQLTIDQLQRQVAELSSELAIVRPALERTTGDLAEESRQRKDTEEELGTITARKDHAEKALSALTTEYEQLKIRFGTEKNRADEAENEVQAVIQAKNQSEQDLTQIINDLKTTATQQATALTRLREESGAEIAGLRQELEAEQSRHHQTGENMNALAAAKEQSEASLQATLAERQKYLLDLQAWLDTAKSQLDEKDQVITALREEIAAVRSARESAEQEAASVSGRLAETGAALADAQRDLAVQKEDLARLGEAKNEADRLTESLTASLKELREELGREKVRAGEDEKRMNLLIRERDQELGELRTAHDDTRTALSSHETALGQTKRDLDAAVLAKADLEDRLRAAEEQLPRIASLSGELDQVKSGLSAEVDRLKSSLERETTRRQESEDQLRDALAQQQQLEQESDRLVAETKSLHADLMAEKKMRETDRRQNQALEEQVSSLNREKSEAVRTAADLTAEIDQARVALADEWGDHMTDNERLTATVERKPLPPRPPAYPGIKREAEIIKKRSLIVKVPSIPTEIRPLPRSMVAIDPVREKEPEGSQIRSVEDLYEDDDESRKKPAAPEVSIVKESGTEPVQDVLPDIMPEEVPGKDSFFEETDEGGSGAGEETSGSESQAAMAGAGPEIFDRARWLDILRWSHHCDALESEQRMHIVRLGRLIQKGRKLTRNQEEQVLEMVALVKSLGYRMS